MFDHVRRLLRDFSFLLKVLQLIFACVSLLELSKYYEYTIPRWLWVVYCIDSSTYAVIYFSIALTHVFEKPRRVPEFTYFSLGVIFNLIGAIAGIVRAQTIVPEDTGTCRSELKIGLLLLANFLVLMCETLHMVYTDFYLRRIIHH